MRQSLDAHWTALLHRNLAVCPRPDKAAYSSKRRAKAHIARMLNTDRINLSAYLCECGTYHIGHRRKATL